MIEFRGPPKCTWQVQLAEGSFLYVTKAPNAFHRFMQRLILGFVWTPIK